MEEVFIRIWTSSMSGGLPELSDDEKEIFGTREKRDRLSAMLREEMDLLSAREFSRRTRIMAGDFKQHEKRM